MAVTLTVIAQAASPALFRPAGVLDRKSALEPYHGPWNSRLAAHLLRRAGFGGSPSDVAHYAAFSPQQAAAALLEFAPLRPGTPIQPPLAREDLLTRDTSVLAAWWLTRMTTTASPLQEKMTLFWHGHFPSSAEKGTIALTLFGQNQLFRSNALGNIRDLTLRVAQDPAMLRYLDNTGNSQVHPNENFARELMELFTLGIGNYSEADVRESARAFTGWQARRQPDNSVKFVNNPRAHDGGVKTFLHQTGNFDGGDIVRIIFEQPACARWFARKLLSFFVYMDPEPELIDDLAALLRHHNYELTPVMRVLLTSNVFYSARAYRALVKSPVQFVVGSAQLFGYSEITNKSVRALRAMGQSVFAPPNVKGWDGGVAWLNSATLLTRENYAHAIVEDPRTLEHAQWMRNAMGTLDANRIADILIATIIQNDAARASYRELITYLHQGSGQVELAELSTENVDQRTRGAAYLTMATPAYQLA